MGTDPTAPRPEPLGPTSFDSPLVNLAAPPLVVLLAIGFRASPFGFLLEGFHVWIHELGHAGVAWLTGHPALPLPFGWTNVEPAKSFGLYLVLLALIAALGAAGWRERMGWPIALSAALLAAQTYMTWALPEDRARLWMIFGGVGGEFAIAAAMVALFYVELPEVFRWGACRYPVLFIGAASFSETYLFWRDVRRGVEGIPYGSMIGGEDDGGGDMNILRDDYHWTQHQITGAYSHLGSACLAAVAAVYLFYNLRLNRLFHPVLARILAVPGDAPPRPSVVPLGRQAPDRRHGLVDPPPGRVRQLLPESKVLGRHRPEPGRGRLPTDLPGEGQ